MNNSIMLTMLMVLMRCAWDIMKAGECVGAVAVNWPLHEGNKDHAGFVERTVWRIGRATVGAGECLEALVNALAVKLGYNDGEVSIMLIPTVPA